MNPHQSISSSKTWAIEKVQTEKRSLVNRFYKECRYPGKVGRNDICLVLTLEQSIVAAVKLEPKADGWWFLRSMCVHPDYRRQGVGTQLLLLMEPYLADKNIYGFPFSHLQQFYKKAHFKIEPLPFTNESDRAYNVNKPQLLPNFVSEAFYRYRQQGRDIVIMHRMQSAE